MTDVAAIADVDAGRARLEEVTREAFATTRRQRSAELRRVRARETAEMLRDGSDPADAAAYLLDSVLGEQASVAGIRVPRRVRQLWRVECDCGYAVEKLLLPEADIFAARHADAECAPVIVHAGKWR